LEDAVLAPPPRASAPRRRRARPADSGASAVEFALLTPLLFMILLGVIQYGYGLYQLQNFSSLVNDASKMAGSGIDDCADFKAAVRSMATSSGIDGATVTSITVAWQAKDPVSGTYTPAGSATRYGLADVTATFTPFRLGAPLVPFPGAITRTQSAIVLDTGLLPGDCP
jgi:Flp pilus assembly protein TadG